MKKVFETKNQLQLKCKEIIKNEENSNENDLRLIKNIISRDNTDPIFVLIYLKMVRKLDNENFLGEIEKYKYFLSKEIINNEFGKFYKKDLSSWELFKWLCDKIMDFDNSMTSTEKMCFFLDITSIETKYNIIKGIADFQNSKELTIYILVHNIQQGIIYRIKKIKSYKIDEKDSLINSFQEKIKEVEKNKNKAINGKELIEQLREHIELKSRIDTDYFSTYFEHFAQFLSSIQESLGQRFTDIEKVNDEEFNLFMDLCFFMTHYDFNSSYYYEEEWIDTLDQTKNNKKTIINNTINKKNENDAINKYEIKDDNLIITNYDYKRRKTNITEVNNIDKYCINRLIDYLSLPKKGNYFEKNKLDLKKVEKLTINKILIDEYHIEKFLKFDSLQETHINKIKNIFEGHLIKIFTSPVMKEAFENLCKKICPKNKNYEYYDFLNEKDLKELFKRSRIIMFETDFFGLTEPTFLIDYEFYRGYIEKYENDCSKLVNLCFILLSKEHEILAHFNVRIQNYLSEKETIKSPLINSSESGEEIRESGEYLESILYGKSLNQLHYNEILFILDLENYKGSLEKFKENFKKCTSDSYKRSDSLNNFLKSLQIDINEKECKKLGSLTVKQNLIYKSSPNNNLFAHRNIHTHLHRPEVSEYTKKIIDDIYASCLNYSRPKH